ncbi:MAG TPA: HD domain-containing phosphohydrolase [Polyangiaceae bacterium]|nr:HD domain-containing phosphohydrolase [Polyangiaceae bacterium]
MLSEVRPGTVRLAELVAALSLGIDLGFGQPMEHVLRQCLIALRLAERTGQSEGSRVAVYYTALLINVGCHSDAHEQAKWFGDDIALKSGKYVHLPGLRGAAATLRLVGAGNPLLRRFRIGIELVLSGHRELDGMIASHSKLAQALAQQLGLPPAVLEAVGTAYEQWDGHGWPGKIAGDAIPIASRIAQLAEHLEVAHRGGGSEAAVALARRRSGKQFDPKLAALVHDRAADIFAGLDSIRAWDAVIAAEPALGVVLEGQQFDAALLAIANFVDLKSPFTLGHSAAVAELAASAGVAMGLSAPEVQTLRRAGLVHDFGRLGVSNSIWDKPGPLGAGEWERIRMHPYITERMLHQSAALAPLGAIAVQHRERLDGSGYPRGTAGSAISVPARIMGAADAYQAMREPRPHRPARLLDEAARLLRGEARSGRLAGDAVEAVLEAAGHRARLRPEGPAGLTAREIEVLRLVARGLSTKEIAQRLAMSPKTAGNHIEHIYAKIDAKNRVAASLFAVEHGLLP